MTKTWSHTCTGTDLVLFVTAAIWQDAAGTGTITACSYNGIHLSKVEAARNTNMAAEIWYLNAPATGTHTVSVTVTGATDAIKLCSASFTGADQTAAVIDNHVSNATATGAPSKAIVTVADNCGVIDVVSRYSTTALTKAAAQTQIYQEHAASTLIAASYLTRRIFPPVQ